MKEKKKKKNHHDSSTVAIRVSDIDKSHNRCYFISPSHHE